MAERWYVAKNKQKLGPFTELQLKRMAAAGQVEPGDMVLREGSAKWAPASSLGWLFTPSEAASPRCYRCQRAAPGTTYHAWVGYLVRSERNANVWAGTVQVRSQYRDMNRHDIFLCRDCALALWKAKYTKEALTFGIPMVACIFLAFILYFVLPVDVRLPITLGVLLLAGLLSPLVIGEVYNVIRPSLQKATMEYIAVAVARKDLEQHGDAIFTESEAEALFR